MGRIVLLGFLLHSAALAAQDDVVKDQPWSLGPYGSLDLGYRQLDVQEPSPMVDFFVDIRNRYEVPAWGYSTGIEAAYTLKDRWGLSLGLQHSNRRFGSKEIPITDIMGTGLGHVTTRYQYTFASVPLMVRYKANRGNVRFEPGIGISYDHALERLQVAEIRFIDGRIERHEAGEPSTVYRDHLATAIAELGISIRAMDQGEIQIRFRGRYQMTTLLDAPLSAHLFDGGLVLGTAFRF